MSRAQGKLIHTHYHGTRVHTAKLTPDDVRLIDALLCNGVKQSVRKIVVVFAIYHSVLCIVSSWSSAFDIFKVFSVASITHWLT